MLGACTPQLHVLGVSLSSKLKCLYDSYTIFKYLQTAAGGGGVGERGAVYLSLFVFLLIMQLFPPL